MLECLERGKTVTQAPLAFQYVVLRNCKGAEKDRKTGKDRVRQGETGKEVRAKSGVCNPFTP